MAHTPANVYVRCPACAWRGQRVPNIEKPGGLGSCPRCEATLIRADRLRQDRKFAKAREELGELEAQR